MTIEDILKEFHGEEGEGAKNPRWQYGDHQSGL